MKNHPSPIKQEWFHFWYFFFRPCILIFDSLAGASRSRVVATLRDYLTCEYKVKMAQEKIFDRDSIKGACPKVPQQNNFTDCGLYVLQYVEQFFNVSNWYIKILIQCGHLFNGILLLVFNLHTYMFFTGFHQGLPYSN